jgi:PAS domain S-box-containing protein
MKPTFLSTASEQARTVQLFQHVRDAVIMLDPAGTVGFWSAGAAQLYGRPAPEALNSNYLGLLHPRCRSAQVPHIHKALEGEESSAEWQTTGPEGEPLWLEGDFRPLTDAHGKRIGCAILLHDVSKWRAAEAARKASDELLRTVTDNVPGTVFQLRVGPDGTRSIVFMSRGVDELLERTLTEMHSGFADGNLVVIPEDRPMFWDGLERSRRTLDRWDAEYRVETPRTGALKWVRLRAMPTRQADGGTVWNGMTSDVTDQVAGAAALRESEARYRLLTENATDRIARLTLAGVFLYASPATQLMFGRPPEQYVGRHVRDFVHPEDLPRMLDVFDRLAAGRRAEPFAHRCLAADGSYVWCESTARAVRNAAGAVTEIVSVTRSTEERRRLEAKVQKSQRMEAVGRLAGGVAHDFNNLLTVINGFSEMILRGLARPDPKRIASQVEEIRKAGERASGLTRQLLAFGRQQVQTRTRVNLNDVVDETKKLVGRVLGEDVEIETALDPELGPIHADVGQIEQLLMNLVLNARDAMPDGGVLTISTKAVRFDRPPDIDVRPGEYVMLAVADTGVGMDEATRARAFEPFFTTKELGKGTGLGLAVAHGIVTQSEGHIAIESERGRGTTVRVYLPRVDPPANGLSRVIGDVVLTGKETVLLVEDDDSVRSVTGAMLRSLGYRVVEAADGIEALRKCRDHVGPIDLLLTDVVMPMMNGREVANRIQGLVPGVKTLFMSGYTDDSILRHGILDEGVAFLSKPLSHEALGRKLREVLGSRAVMGSSVG